MSLPINFAVDIYASTQNGGEPIIPIADEGCVSIAYESSWANLRKPDNRTYGVDILVLRLVGRIRELEALIDKHHDISAMHSRCGKTAMANQWGAECRVCSVANSEEAINA